jgi:hypothetical protein
MITNSRFGWCDFKIGTFEGNPSYLTDVPVDLLDAFLDYREKGMGVAWFDEEGSMFTFVLNPYSAFIIEERETSILHEISQNIDDLEEELIEDIEANLAGWTEFFPTDDREEILQHRNEIRERLIRLKELRSGKRK